MSATTDVPELGAVIRDAVMAQPHTPATARGDDVYVSPGVSHSYLVATEDGSVVINAGSASEAPHHLRRYREITSEPPTHLITTQSHGDHIGGVAQLAGPDTVVIAHRAQAFERSIRDRLQPFFGRRAAVAFGPVLGGVQVTVTPTGPRREPDILVDESYAFTAGGRRFELLSVPGGETTDSLAVWLPDARAVFTGNLLGPLFGHLPNLYTIRGDRYRSALELVASIERVRQLEPETVHTGHGGPIRGWSAIDAALAQVRDAVQHLHDRTVEGMNAGADVWALMREIALPAELALPETHGKVAWCVRGIWEYYAGWYHADSVAELYPVPRRQVDPDLVALAGAGPLVDRARTHLDAGRAVEALHLTDVVLGVEGGFRPAVEVRRLVVEHLLHESRNENISEVMWLRRELDVLASAEEA